MKTAEGMVAALEAICDYLADCQVGQSFTLATLKEEVEEDTPDLVLDWGRNDKTRDSLSSACSKCITAFSNQGLLICRPKKTFQVTEELIYLASAYDGPADYERFMECYNTFKTASNYRTRESWAEYGASGELAARCRIYVPAVKDFLKNMNFDYDLLLRRHKINTPYFRKRQSIPMPRIS